MVCTIVLGPENEPCVIEFVILKEGLSAERPCPEKTKVRVERLSHAYFKEGKK